MEQQLFFQQRFLLSPKLLISLDVLIKPLGELAEWLTEKIEENPLLSSSAVSRVFQGNKIPEKALVVEQRDLYESLKAQAREIFLAPEELKKAYDLIHELDEKGFLPHLTKMDKILSTLQTFDPPGIAARSIRECLALQLKRKNASSASLMLVEHYYDDLLHGRFKQLARSLKLSALELKTLIKEELSHLTTSPAKIFRKEPDLPWIPDLILTKIDGKWKVEVNTSLLPKIKIGLSYPTPEQDASCKNYLKEKGKEARYVLSAIKKRNAMLIKLGSLLIKFENEYFEGLKEYPRQLLVEEVAPLLQVHPSTLYRAVANKVVSTPLGIVSLAAFFRHASSLPSNVEERIEKLILEEDKRKPLSDACIAKHLSELGIACSRRTVSKYRNVLCFPVAKLRKT
jgi:RNA polymerase sigma-54 factor